MVAQHFKLREQAFGVTPDPKYLYASASHREALASLLYGLQSGLGFVSLIAKPGMGKTTLLFDVLRRLRDTRTTVFLFQAITTPVELLRSILIDLGIRDVRESLVDLQTQLNKVLLNQYAAHKSVVVVIDEAQNLNDSVLETVRMLSNFETASHKLMQIILVGQPQLAEKLMSPDLLQLRQRISIFAHLTPLSMTETSAYIQHRLKLAGLESNASVFTPAAVALIARHSEGIPRNINNLCFNAMSLAFALKRSEVGPEIVDEVISDLNVQEHLLAAQSYQFEPSEGTPVNEAFHNHEDNSSESTVSGSLEAPLYSTPESLDYRTSKPSPNKGLTLGVDLEDVKQVPEIACIPEPPFVHSQSTSSANTHRVANSVTEASFHSDGHSAPAVVEPVSPQIKNEPAPQLAALRWEQESRDQTFHLNDRSPHSTNDLRSNSPDYESTSDEIAPLDKSLFEGFEQRATWRARLQPWNHTVIAAIVAGVAILVSSRYVDYATIFQHASVQASAKLAAPDIPNDDSESAGRSESVPDPSQVHKGSIRVKKAESLATLCHSLYGECSSELLEQLLELNPSLLYPNRLHPGQVISIPLDPHNAKTER